MIDACAKGKLWRRALQLLEEMEDNGIPPTAITYRYVRFTCVVCVMFVERIAQSSSSRIESICSFPTSILDDAFLCSSHPISLFFCCPTVSQSLHVETVVNGRKHWRFSIRYDADCVVTKDDHVCCEDAYLRLPTISLFSTALFLPLLFCFALATQCNSTQPNSTDSCIRWWCTDETTQAGDQSHYV